LESHTSYTSLPSLSAKQLELIGIFKGLIAANGITLEINPNRDAFFGNCPYALDIEHDEQGNLVGIGICKESACFYWTSIPNDLKYVLEASTLICHNGISDFECLRQWGVAVKDEQLVHDTMLVGHVLDSSLKAYGLKDMAKRELGLVYPSYDDIVGRRTAKQAAERLTLEKQPIELVALYNACDTFVTFKLYEKQIKSTY